MGRTGIVSDEMITLAGSRTGGFGWATRLIYEEFRADLELASHPIVLTRNADIRAAAKNTRKGARGGDDEVDIAVLRTGSNRDPRDLARLWSLRLRRLVLIDYRPYCDLFLRARPDVPVILWVRDPKGPSEQAQLDTLREPGFPDDVPHGTRPMATQRLNEVLSEQRLGVGRCRVAVVSPFLKDRTPGAYGLEAESPVHLPNIFDEVDVDEDERSPEPTVLMVGRFDPVKRLWVALELARRMPSVQFLVAGKRHAQSRWQPQTIPDNVHLVGEVFGEEKDALFRRAWVLLNTSIHEGLPVTFQEALTYRLPIASFLDPEEVPSRFGFAAGPEPGDGLAGLNRLQEGLEWLLNDHDERRRRGEEGQRWVRRTHNRHAFREAWQRLVTEQAKGGGV